MVSLWADRSFQKSNKEINNLSKTVPLVSLLLPLSSLPGVFHNTIPNPTIGAPISINATAVAQPTPTASIACAGRKIADMIARTAEMTIAC